MDEHAPGWYDHQGERRYWDGTRWTHASSVQSTPHHQLPPPVQPQPYPQSQALPVPMPVVPIPPYPGALPVPRKEPGISLLLSAIIPGAGSMVNGDVGAGVAFLTLYVLGLVLVICLGWILVGLIGIPMMILAWGWGMYHAYQGAVDFNRRAGYQN